LDIATHDRLLNCTQTGDTLLHVKVSYEQPEHHTEFTQGTDVFDHANQGHGYSKMSEYQYYKW
jgi:hypothetical protein